MIRFFRKIRQQELRENNLGKYLLYATGEILLVVIGILIALQINSWSEERKKEALRVSYKMSLINDLTMDTLLLSDLIAENYGDLESLDKQRGRFLGKDTPVDTLIKIARSEFNPNLNTRFQYNRNTLNTLISSGNIDLFSSDFNEMLMTLISSQDIARENTRYFAEIYSSKISRYSDEFLVSRHQNSNIVNSIWADTDETKLASSFIGLTDLKAFAHYTFIKEIENVKEETSSILEQLKSN